MGAMKAWAMDQMKTRIVAGKRITLSLTEFEGLDPECGGKWLLMCESHGFILQDTNRRRLWAWSNSPEDWCEECRTDDRVTVSE